MFVDEIVVFVIAKLVDRKVLGVDTEKVDEQFMYCCSEKVEILASITILIVIYFVEGGFLALLRTTEPAAVVSLL